MKRAKQLWLERGCRVFPSTLNTLVMAGAIIAAFAIFFITITTTVDVGMRFLLGAGTMWVLEFSRYALVAQVFFGLAYTLREKGHIRITFLVNRLPVKVQNWFNLFAPIMFLIYTSVLFHLTWDFFAISFVRKTTSVTAVDIIVWPFQVFIPLGLAIISLLLIRNIYTELRIILVGRKVPSEEEEKGAIV